MEALSTRIVFSVDVTVPSEMTAAGLFSNHGLDNFIHGAGKGLVEQLKESVAQQVAEQHAAVVADVRRYWELYRELERMFENEHPGTVRKTRAEGYDDTRARTIKEEMEGLLAKYGAEDEYVGRYFRLI